MVQAGKRLNVRGSQSHNTLAQGKKRQWASLDSEDLTWSLELLLAQVWLFGRAGQMPPLDCSNTNILLELFPLVVVFVSALHYVYALTNKIAHPYRQLSQHFTVTPPLMPRSTGLFNSHRTN